MLNDKEDFKYILKRILGLFNSNNINYWIDFGTLLGAIRDKDIIEWDYDADISVISKDIPRAIQILYENLVFKKPIIHHMQCFADGGVKILLIDNKYHIDIYPWKIDGDIVKYFPYFGEEQSSFGLPFFPVKEIESFTNIKFMDMNVRVPTNHHDRLTRLYGDYMIPVKPDEQFGVYWTGEKIKEHAQKLKNNKITIPIYKPFLPPNSLKHAHRALDSTWISSQGAFISMVTDRLQDLLNVKYVLPVNNGTSACHLVAKAAADKLNIHDVIVPNNVYTAAWNAFLFDSNWNIFSVECDLKTWNYDLVALDSTIKNHPTAAVLIVHNIGNIIDVPSLKLKYPNTIFLEDNCEGFLGKYQGVYSGTASYASAISFFGNKNITSGEGGAFITNDEEVYSYIKSIHSQGQSSTRFIHDHLGYNYRITNIQAAILFGQIGQLPQIMDRKNILFEKYRKHLSDREDVLTQFIDPNTEHSNWMLGVRVPGNKNYTEAELYFNNQGIEIRPMFYPITAHPYLKDKDYVEISDCTNAHLLNKECFILPSYPEITDEEQNHILTTLDKYIKAQK